MYDIYTKGVIHSGYKDFHKFKRALTKFYWVIDDSIEFDQSLLAFKPDNNYTYYFKTENESIGAVLFPSKESLGIKVINTNTKVNNHLLMDIVYIMNGEKDAEKNLEKLRSLDLPNNIHVIKDVKGRANAYKAAANVSTTPYFYAVFAKIDVNPNFDFSWCPATCNDIHYIFSITNPVNGLEYGHQAIILYNKKLVLENKADQLDFTLAQPYHYISRNSGIAVYNTDAISTWRTAFREVLKLKVYQDEDKINKWLTGDSTQPYYDYSIKGAKDAIDYHNSVNGDMEQLLLSYEWEWLHSYFDKVNQ